MQSEIAAHLVLGTHVGARRRIIADQHDRESGSPAALLQLGNFIPQSGVNFVGDRAAFDEFRHEAEILRRSHGCSTRLIMAPCRRSRSVSNCSGSESGPIRIGSPKIARKVANGFGTTKRSQLFIRQQLEYSMWIGTMGAPLF